MILYRPTDGDVHGAAVAWRPRTAFVMAQLGGPIPDDVVEAREAISSVLADSSFATVDADSITTGKDFLLKIWQLVLSVPVGIAVVHKGIRPRTMANIFYELGWMHAYGKETVVVRVGNVPLPSDLVRTEHIPFDAQFDRRFRSFVSGLDELAAYYSTFAEQVENNPLLAIDYLRRAYLLSGDGAHSGRAKSLLEAASLEGRAKNSVEMLLSSF